MRFDVIDLKTGKYPDMESIARNEEWARGLVYCDMQGFAITDDGLLIILDECGNFAYCPHKRFAVTLELDD